MADVVEKDVLTSLWGGLSKQLIAQIYEVEELSDESTGKSRWAKVKDGKVVAAPLADGANLDITLSWQSPFENTGADSKAPTLMAMLQSGALQPLIDETQTTSTELLSKISGGRLGRSSSTAAEAQRKSNAFMAQFAGRTSITKLNSTQMFSGMPPLKFSITALFRAWSDPQREVEDPFNQLMAWALPEELSPDGTLIVSTLRAARGDALIREALMPSIAPTKVGILYKGRTYSPLVIESVGVPISSGVNEDGKYVELAVPLTICSLTAIDRRDWASIQKGGNS
ncbi:hypothetical protein [Uliginosibacterium sediminicola]|uniref:Uncharacterized protein n=1 Tax=Uliginosibacterium sediminicola TaxID=2024550 RepID=A0ABU9YVZ5_9RHOO